MRSTQLEQCRRKQRIYRAQHADDAIEIHAPARQCSHYALLWILEPRSASTAAAVGTAGKSGDARPSPD